MINDLVSVELGYIGLIIRKMFGTQFTIRFIAVFPSRLFFKMRGV